MRLAHVREIHAPAGAPWRLPPPPPHGGRPRRARDRGARRGLDLDPARRRLVTADPRRAHNAVLFRQPVTTLDEHLARGLRVAALGQIVEGYAGAADDDEAQL